MPMPDLEFKIGRVKLNPEHIRYLGGSSYYAHHKFVVEAMNGTARIYACVANRHKQVVDFFSLRGREIVGGGSLYLDKDNLLTLDDWSQDYGRIPAKAAHRFAELIYPELDSQMVEASGIMQMPAWNYRFDIRSYWDGKTF